RAAGAVTFNVLTTVFTGGAGAAAAGAGKAGAVAKALSVAGKAGRVIDPMTYIAKGAGAGLSKIGDITKGLKGVGNIDIPQLPENAVTLPQGTVMLADGTVHLPEGADIPAGATKLPEGNVRLPDDAPVLPEGTTRLPTEDGAPARYFDPDGNILDEHGNVLQKSADGPGDVVDQPEMPDTPGTPASDADTPRVNSPVKEPALVGAATHTAEQAGRHIRLGDSLDNNLGDIGRVPDDGVTPVVHAGGDFPSASSVGDHMPGGAAGHTPGGHVGDHMPTNELDNARPGGDGTPPTGTGRPDTPSTAGHTDGPSTGGTHGDGPGAGGGHHEPPTTGGGLPGGVADMAHGADDAAGGAAHHADEAAQHRAEYEAAREKPADERTPQERAAITREHVRLANEDPVWRAEHYDKWGIGKRNSAEKLVDGQVLPQLTEKPGGGWMATHDLPHGPSETKLDPAHLGPDTAPAHSRPHLDESARNRRLSVDLMNAERAFDDTPSAANADALDKAQKAYDEHLGGIPNNSKHSEALGEAAARHHVIPKEFPGAERIELPKTPNGANMFDDVYKLSDDGDYLIVEEKAPSGDLDWRKGKADPDPLDPNAHDGGAHGMRVKQGTRPYIRTILAEMTHRGGKDAEIAADLRAALRDGKVQYVLVKAVDNAGHSYAGAVIEHLKI
ncbi:hypothetical protein ABT373_40705, partial [Streptomyces sp. NPDC000070]